MASTKGGSQNAISKLTFQSDHSVGAGQIVDRMAAEAKKALADPELKKKLEQQGIVAMGTTPEEFKTFVGEEVARWKQVITAADIKAE